MNQLKESMQKRTTMNPESHEGRGQLIYLFLGQSADDIRQKLQKLQGARDTEKMLEVAWQVY